MIDAKEFDVIMSSILLRDETKFKMVKDKIFFENEFVQLVVKIPAKLSDLVLKAYYGRKSKGEKKKK